MRKLKLLLATMLVSCCCAQGAWAERVAPTMPEAQIPVSGETYYLYNVEYGSYLMCYTRQESTNYRNYWSVSSVGQPVHISKIDDNTISINFNSYSSPYYIWYSSTTTLLYQQLYTVYYSCDDENTFTLSCNFGKNDWYIGVKKNESVFPLQGISFSDLSDNDCIHWKFFFKEDAERYIAEYGLYRALINADIYPNLSNYITKWENDYQNRASFSNDELARMTWELNKAVSLSTSTTNLESEYPLFFSTLEGYDKNEDDNYTWVGHFQREIHASDDLEKSVLSAIVTGVLSSLNSIFCSL